MTLDGDSGPVGCWFVSTRRIFLRTAGQVAVSLPFSRDDDGRVPFLRFDVTAANRFCCIKLYFLSLLYNITVINFDYIFFFLFFLGGGGRGNCFFSRFTPIGYDCLRECIRRTLHIFIVHKLLAAVGMTCQKRGIQGTGGGGGGGQGRSLCTLTFLYLGIILSCLINRN